MVGKVGGSRAEDAVEYWWQRLQLRAARPNLYRGASPERVGIVHAVAGHLTVDERLLLFALIRGLRPRTVLEIGSLHGASAAIITSALEDTGSGCLVGVDPAPAIRETPRRLHNRFDLVAGESPEALTEARNRAGAPFDFVHWDAINIYKKVHADLSAVFEHLAEEAYLLINNPMHYGVHQAVAELVESRSELHDCGFLCNTPRIHDDPRLAYAGLRLLRWSKDRVARPEPHLERAYGREGEAVPVRDPRLLNHDMWYCRTVEPCDVCVEEPSKNKRPLRATPNAT
jgi:predicted O-methyltransferase YrrM